MSAKKFLRRICSLIPPAKQNLVRYFGVLGPAAKLRPFIVPHRNIDLGLPVLPIEQDVQLPRSTGCTGAAHSRALGIPLAKAVNQIRNRTGTVFHRRYSAEQILDDNAFVDRVLYVIMNPVRAGLVRSFAQWPGVLLWAKAQATEYTFGWVDKAKYERHQKLRLKRPRTEYIRKSKLHLASLEGEKALQSVITKAENLVRESRKGLGVLGLRKILKQDPFSKPNAPKKSPRPKCHTTCKDLRRVFRKHMWALRDAYCEVSAAFRRGDVSIKFPSYTFRPFAWVPS